MKQKNISNPQASVLPTLSQQYVRDTEAFIQSNSSYLMDEAFCASSLVDNINVNLSLQNAVRDNKQALLKDIPIVSVVMLMAVRGDVALIAGGDKSLSNRKKALTTEQRSNLPIGIYQEDGDNEGVWEITNQPLGVFGDLLVRYKPNASIREKREAFALIKTMLPVKEKCVIPYYVPVNNGIVDVLNKKLLPFSPDLVFTAKIHTNLNLAATNPVIQIPGKGTWDVDSWLNSLGSPSFVFSIKEVIQAACLPLAPRNKMAIFYSENGCSWKGTICQTIRNILGEESTISIPINEFSSRFALANLPNALAIVTDENDVNSFSKGMGVLKSVITSDVCSIERKGYDSYSYRFNGLVLQCVNDKIRSDDKSFSFLRRLHVIPFEHSFAKDGNENKLIKEYFIHRTDVLEYILKMVLVDMAYRDSFTETAETKAALQGFISATNNVVAFLDEVLAEAQWDLLPATDLLYESYKQYAKKVSPSGNLIGRNDFIASIKEYVDTKTRENPNFEWEWTDSTRTDNYIDFSVREPLVENYPVEPFNRVMYESSHGYALVDRSKVKDKYSGLKRCKAASPSQGTNN